MQESRNLSASKIRKIATTRSLAAALQFRSHTCDLHRRDVKISCKNRRVAIVCVCVSASVRVYACVCVCVRDPTRNASFAGAFFRGNGSGIDRRKGGRNEDTTRANVDPACAV